MFISIPAPSEKMDEDNPLHFIPLRINSKHNKSGRPSNEKIVRFSAQPQSHISQMLKRIKKEKVKASLAPGNPVSENLLKTNTIDEDSLEGDHWNVSSTQINDYKEDVNVKPIMDSPKRERNKIYSCHFANCSYKSKFSSNLIKHRRTHTAEKPFMCDLCSFRSNFVNSLKVHKRIHTDQRPYACTYCFYRCNSSSNLKKHCKHRHGK